VDKVPVFFADFKRIETGKASRVIHKTVEQPELFPDLAKHTSDFWYVRQVSLKNRSVTRGRRNLFRLSARLIAMNRNPKPAPRQFDRKHAANSLGRARH
jgi:hypothetical protein